MTKASLPELPARAQWRRSAIGYFKARDLYRLAPAVLLSGVQDRLRAVEA
jgi:hypothetical protein